MIKVMLVDDHAVVREGYRRLLEREDDMSVVAEAGEAASAYRLYKTASPDVVVMDITMPGRGGIDLVKQLRQWDPKARVLMFSMHANASFALQSFRAGAKGYVMKQHPPETLLEAIKQVLKGKVYLSPQMSDRMLGKLVGAGGSDKPAQSPIEKLSDRELEVLQLIGKGQTTAQIADKLCLSVKTIETYREHLKQKLNLKSGPELVRYAIEWSLSQS